jgi:hypothetical protein
MLRRQALLALSLLGAFGGLIGWAQDNGAADPAADRRQALRDWMQDFAQDSVVRVIVRDEPQPSERVDRPVFRYSDEPRKIPDAALWVWTRAGRPVALQKVEASSGGAEPQWTICFASLSEQLLDVQWPVGRQYQSQKPGVEFQPIPDAEPPAAAGRLRTLQMKRLKDRFTGRIGSGRDKEADAEARVLPTPLFAYDDPVTKLPLGSLFALTATGTNPDLLLLLEVRPGPDRQPRWEYALARMTNGKVKVLLDGHLVWDDPTVPINNPVFPTWTFYFLTRTLPDPH